MAMVAEKISFQKSHHLVQPKAVVTNQKLCVKIYPVNLY